MSDLLPFLGIFVLLVSLWFVFSNKVSTSSQEDLDLEGDDDYYDDGDYDDGGDFGDDD